jgi:Glyoxalase/Bleomycin resistance protein/Dioxygenase superfamily
VVRNCHTVGVAGIDFTSVAPIIPVRNLDAALERYRRLGFDTRGYAGPDRYGFADRGSVSMHLTESGDHDPLRTAASVYLYVSDADALYAEWKALKNLGGRFIAPFDTPYSLREFAYIDPDGTAHRVGSRNR